MADLNIKPVRGVIVGDVGQLVARTDDLEGSGDELA